MRIVIDLPDTGELEQLASEATTSARPARIALGHALQGAIVAALRRSGAPGHRIVTHLPPHTEHRRAELPADREALRKQVAAGMREMFGARAYYTLTAADVGRHTLRIFGRNVPASHFIGQVLPGDVGKRVYDTGDGIVQVENEAQRAARVAKG